MKNKKRITIGVVVVLLALAAILAVIMLKKFAPNNTHMSLTKYSGDRSGDDAGCAGR